MINLQKLWDMQQLEARQGKIERMLKQNDIVLELRRIKRNIEAGQREFKSMKERYRALEREIDQEDYQVGELKKQITELNGKLFGGEMLNKKEIAGAEKRIAALKRQVNETENAGIMLLEEQEILKNKLLKLSEILKEQREEFYLLRERYYQMQKKNQDELSQIIQSKEKLSQGIDGEVMQLFYKMQEKLKKPVAKVEDGVCGGCHMTVTFDKLKELKKNKIVKCDNCGRLIFKK
ncbi:zinc ribbon domain-containing protein [Desulfofalx alkaliphila]|uniref:zinc ribbon domain-containing protein n=1 Tax=Desulfofalx alkaliphila TaxID=105483 RepID=UPI0004E23CFD|nr:C4-type zinc ribbon domain-containing protein [Desulfofalx alkaliphila]